MQFTVISRTPLSRIFPNTTQFSLMQNLLNSSIFELFLTIIEKLLNSLSDECPLKSVKFPLSHQLWVKSYYSCSTSMDFALNNPSMVDMPLNIETKPRNYHLLLLVALTPTDTKKMKKNVSKLSVNI